MTGMPRTGYLPVVGWAKNCAITKFHTPPPIRYVWHHILPQACGGKTKPDNLVSVCDNCHYAIHALLHDLKMHDGKFTIASTLRNRKRAGIALDGYRQAQAAGTVNKIPNEGE